MVICYNVTHPNLEITDPNPNIIELFRNFNCMFFESKLSAVTVKWSPTMKYSAGMCSFEPRSRFCEISLSELLLKLRPRKDLVETLLHEMIHAYLFLYENDSDREGHGPNFKRLMNQINEMTGANISIYHNFHNEVYHYKSNWYRCTGRCRKNRPLFGFVKGKKDRGPCNKDRWYAMHKATCGGTFVKCLVGPTKSMIKKEITKNESNHKNKRIQTTLKSENGLLSLTKEPSQSQPPSSIKNVKTNKSATTKKSKNSKELSNNIPFSGVGMTLGRSINTFNSNYETSRSNQANPINNIKNVNIHETIPPKRSKDSNEPVNNIPFSGIGIMLGSSFDTSNSKYEISMNNKPKFAGHDQVIEKKDFVKIPANDFNNIGVQPSFDNSSSLEKAIQISLLENNQNQSCIFVECPACPKQFRLSEINAHLNSCLQ